MSFPRTFIDHLGRTVLLPTLPERIVSLCPSQTETLVAMGIGDRLVGRTRFCIHPVEALRKVKNVGGTKEVNFERIRALKPDLIIGEKEENTAAMVAALELEWPVYMTDVRDLEGAGKMILDLGAITGLEKESEAIQIGFQASLEAIRPLVGCDATCVYLIWKFPWMGAGSDTFIDSVLQKCGFINLCFDLPGRYPMLDKDFFLQKTPKIVLLSTEPFPFKDAHVAELQKIIPKSLIKIVDGEMFSWYGSHMVGVENYVNLLLQEIRVWLSLHD